MAASACCFRCSAPLATPLRYARNPATAAPISRATRHSTATSAQFISCISLHYLLMLICRERPPEKTIPQCLSVYNTAAFSPKGVCASRIHLFSSRASRKKPQHSPILRFLRRSLPEDSFHVCRTAGSPARSCATTSPFPRKRQFSLFKCTPQKTCISFYGAHALRAFILYRNSSGRHAARPERDS